MDATATAGHGHDAEHSPEEIRKHVKKYYAVGGILYVLTVVTVLIAYLHLPAGKAITIAMAVAALKASMVAAVFMHLSTEKKIIFWCLWLTGVFFVVLMCAPSLTTFETYERSEFAAPAAGHAGGGRSEGGH